MGTLFAGTALWATLLPWWLAFLARLQVRRCGLVCEDCCRSRFHFSVFDTPFPALRDSQRTYNFFATAFDPVKFSLWNLVREFYPPGKLFLLHLSMGWAPNFVLTGPWTLLAYCITFVNWFSYTLLHLFRTFWWIYSSGDIGINRTSQFHRHSGTPTTTRSQVRACRLFRIVAILATVIFLVVTGDMRGEGSSMGMNAGGIEGSPSMKNHAEEPIEASGPFTTCRQHRSVAKRSFRRAVRRAATNGFTWYRGRLYSASQMGTYSSQPTLPTPTTSHLNPKRSQHRSRMTVFNWNAGGLSRADWDMFQQWIETQTIDLVSIQETHWKYTSEWLQSNYFAVHSGGPDGHSGILCLISKRLCNQNDLAWTELVPGRLVHIRIHGLRKHIDFICLYQHVHAITKLEQREEIWHQLNGLLTKLPSKHVLVLMGDFNTSLQGSCSAVGETTYLHDGAQCSGPRHRDMNTLLTTLTSHDLCALNTWTHDAGPTYRFGDQHSRIDFICSRRMHADHTAMNVQYLWQFPLLGLTGSQHVPQICSVLKVWHVQPRPTQPGWTKSQRLELGQQWQHPNERVLLLQQDVLHEINRLPQDGDRLDHVHPALAGFRPHRPPTKPTPIHRHDLTPFQLFQTHTTALRALRGKNLMNIFQAWFHVHKRTMARKQMNTVSTNARKQRLQQIYQVADEAEQAKDHFRMFQAIRKLAPKQRFHRIQVRSQCGNLLTPAQEADEIQRWFANLYEGQALQPDTQQTQWPFSSTEMGLGLAQLPLLKALSPEYAPAPFWRLSARPIAEYLHDFLQECYSQQTVPSCWGEGTLCFLPKNSKRTQAPSELRPIALLEPSGKAVMGVFSLRLMSEVQHELRQWPQFAYLQHRSCEDALHRLSTHCEQVRSIMELFQHPLQQRASGRPELTLGGGITLSLDLSKAFDSVCREQLMAGLERLGVSVELRHLLSLIYSGTSFKFWHRDEFRTFPTTRGIRQGCKAAPGLWACFSVILIQAISGETSLSWALDCITMYADDTCFHEVIQSEAGLHRTMAFLGKALDVLESFKLSINLTKTVALWRLGGPLSRKLQKQYVRRTPDGTFLHIPRVNGKTTYIRLVKHFQYLGTTVSYHAHERLTMMARIQASHKTGMQLHRWLHVQHSLTPIQKYRLWKQCVFACLRYGLVITGLTRQSLQMFDLACLKQLRRIYRAPTHLTRTSHGDFLAEHGLPEPLLLLIETNFQTAQRDTQNRQSAMSNDIILRLPPRDFQAQHLLIQEVLQQLRSRHDLPTTVQESHQVCPHCFIICADLATLRRHLTLEHDERSGQIRPFHWLDAKEGVPTLCKMQLSILHQTTIGISHQVCLPRTSSGSDGH